MATRPVRAVPPLVLVVGPTTKRTSRRRGTLPNIESGFRVVNGRFLIATRFFGLAYVYVGGLGEGEMSLDRSGTHLFCGDKDRMVRYEETIITKSTSSTSSISVGRKWCRGDGACLNSTTTFIYFWEIKINWRTDVSSHWQAKAWCWLVSLYLPVYVILFYPNIETPFLKRVLALVHIIMPRISFE